MTDRTDDFGELIVICLGGDLRERTGRYSETLTKCVVSRIRGVRMNLFFKVRGKCLGFGAYVCLAAVGLSASGCGSSDPNFFGPAPIIGRAPGSSTGPSRPTPAPSLSPAPTPSPAPTIIPSPSPSPEPPVSELPNFPTRPNERGFVLVNTSDSGHADGRSSELLFPDARISADGSFLFFVTNALNIISKAVPDPIFPDSFEGFLAALDLASGEAEPLAVTRAGSDRPGDHLFTYFPYFDVSEDGSYVLFITEAPIAGDGAEVSDGSYRMERVTGRIEPVCIAPNGARFNEKNEGAVFLGGPDRVVFQVDRHLYLRDLNQETTTDLGPGEIFFGGKIASGDGSKLLFEGKLSPDEDRYNYDNQLYLRDFAAGTVTRVTSKPDGSPAFLGSSGYSISDDGLSVGFLSYDEDLDPHQAGNSESVYFYDVASRTIELIEKTSYSPVSRWVTSANPVVSNDGNFIVYTTSEYRLPRVPYDDRMDFYTLHDRRTGQKAILTDRIENPNVRVEDYFDNSLGLSLTKDGRYVTFIARRANDLAYETLYLYDLVADQLRDIGQEQGLFQAANVKEFAISSDGFKVFFNSNELLDMALHAGKTVPDLGHGVYRTYLTDLKQDELREVSRNEDGSPYSVGLKDYGTQCTDVGLSSDGKRGVFVTSFALVNESEDSSWMSEDAFYFEEGTNSVQLLSTGIGTSASVVSAAISGDGNIAAFSSSTLTLINFSTGARTNLRDGVDGIIGLNFKGLTFNEDGQWLAFTSGEPYLDGTVSNARRDVWLTDTEAGQMRNLTAPFNGDSGRDKQLELTADGRFLIFTSEASDIVVGDTNNKSDVFIYDREHDSFSRVSLDSDGAQLNGASQYGSISDDGRYLVFSSRATGLAPDDDNNTADVFVKDLQTGELRLLSTTASGATPEATSDACQISGNGRWVAFRSYADDIVQRAAPFSADLFHAKNPLAP